MNRSDRFLQRLAAAATQDEAPPPDELPLGLATRVLERLRERPAPSIWEASALWAQLTPAQRKAFRPSYQERRSRFGWNREEMNQR